MRLLHGTVGQTRSEAAPSSKTRQQPPPAPARPSAPSGRSCGSGQLSAVSFQQEFGGALFLLPGGRPRRLAGISVIQAGGLPRRPCPSGGTAGLAKLHLAMTLVFDSTRDHVPHLEAVFRMHTVQEGGFRSGEGPWRQTKDLLQLCGPGDLPCLQVAGPSPDTGGFGCKFSVRSVGDRKRVV